MNTHRPNKRFGQNFLTVPYYINRIIAAVPDRVDERVVEIGPGKGALSTGLAKRSHPLTLIELDREIIPQLQDTLKASAGYTIIQADAAALDYAQFSTPFHIVGNLPYNKAAHIIKQILFTAQNVQTLTCMVQREVARRICNKDKGKKQGFSTILCNYFGNTQLLFDVPPGAFFPKPKVTSSVFQLSIDPEKSRRIPQDKIPAFFHFVSCCFQTRRKKLATPLSGFVSSREQAHSALISCDISENARPEELEADQWVALYKTIS
ncbi:MAG: 16S rRNA (adenine(1518)-N(6)/adenine(1519)-N(6))-dimethyltransferase RsmA [Fibrobacterota bacterium]